MKGVLWLDRATAELRRVKYQYTNLGFFLGAEKTGGELEFQSLPGGAWIVSRSWIRMPTLGHRRVRYRWGLSNKGFVLKGFKQDGGEVTAIRRVANPWDVANSVLRTEAERAGESAQPRNAAVPASPPDRQKRAPASIEALPRRW